MGFNETETTLKPASFPFIASFDDQIDTDFRDMWNIAAVGATSDPYTKERLYDAAMDGWYMRTSDPGHIATNNDVMILNARSCFPTFGYALTFKQKMRFSAPPGSVGVDPFYAWTLYCGEEYYLGIYFGGGSVPVTKLLYPSWLSIVNHNSLPDFTSNHIYQFEFIYTPGATRSDNVTIDIYLDDVAIATAVKPPTLMPLNVWVGGRIQYGQLMDIAKLYVDAS